jgi:hypothetical protein
LSVHSAVSKEPKMSRNERKVTAVVETTARLYPDGDLPRGAIERIARESGVSRRSIETYFRPVVTGLEEARSRYFDWQADTDVAAEEGYPPPPLPIF